MSQHDLDIANQTASSARSDINSALKALGSNNSGPSAPPTTYANMMWYDTTDNILKIRSEADDAWINIGYLDQALERFEPENAIPAGAVNTFAMNSAPTGWLSCDGSLVSRTTYSDLFSVVGTLYGAGDGSTTFKLPDLRGEFVRGFDAGRGVDSGRSFGSAQGDAIRNLTGTFDTSKPNAATGIVSIEVANIGPAGDGSQYSGARYKIDASTQVPTADENRPRNIALLYCIKY